MVFFHLDIYFSETEIMLRFSFLVIFGSLSILMYKTPVSYIFYGLALKVISLERGNLV